MKKLIIINGTMGIGKTTISKLLCERLNKSAFLDGDWCFDLHPFVATTETLTMAINNIAYLIDNYLNCKECNYIVFSWFINNEKRYERILNAINDGDLMLYRITLTCNEESLKDRWNNDKVTEWRTEQWLMESVKSIKCFEQMEAIKIDTSNLSKDQVVNHIIQIVS